jgi:acetylornithine deacetylase/succinyl-diaminopimelate desuccinylase-like protein
MSTRRGLSRRAFVGGAGAIAASLGAGVTGAASQQSLELAEARRDELISLLSDMIRVQSLSGESGADAQQVVKDYLGRLPYRVEESADRPSRYAQHPEYMTPNPPGDGPFINVVGWPEKSAGKQYAMFSQRTS